MAQPKEAKPVADTAIPQVYNPQQLLTTMQNIFDKSQIVMVHLLSNYIEKHGDVMKGQIEHDPLNISNAFHELLSKLLAEPNKLFDAQVNLWMQHVKLWENIMLRAIGRKVDPIVSPAKTDKRFSHPTWESTPLFDFIKQSYLLTACWLQATIKSVELEEPSHAKKIEFYTRQMIDALAPSNFVATNPEVLSTALKTCGDNLLKGLNNFLEDLARGKGQLQIRMTDLNAFEHGKNVAATPGKVIYQNDLMQLIQYQPTTTEVYARPLLIVPPWINKYYILDLHKKNSFVKWVVDQGHTVFVISWVNPDVRLAHKDFNDYMVEGILSALDVIEKVTGQREVNTVGYCLGGTLLASTLAYMAATKDTRIVSGTFFTTMLDFTDPGDLGIFIDEPQIDALEKKMKAEGYLEGSNMASTFTMLRANDLVWSFYINNYLLGKDPTVFDLLFWNSDSTRMPAKMHTFYLRNMYLQNLLREPNGITLNGVGIDLSKVKVPAYFVSAQEDHIAPWPSTFAGAQLFSGPVKFILGGSGHIAGIINPPASNKYFYYTNNKLGNSHDTWLKGAKQNPGSWWTDWAKWVGGYAGDKVAPRVPGEGGLPALEDAPGSYVKVSVLKNNAN